MSDKRSVAPRGPSPAVVNSSTALVEGRPVEPFCVLFAGQFILALPNAEFMFPLDLIIEDRWGARRLTSVPSGHQVNAMGTETFTCIIVPLADLTRVSLNVGQIKVTLMAGHDQQFSSFLRAEPLDVNKANDLPVARTLHSLVKAGFIDSRIGLVFDSSTVWIEQDEASEFGIDSAYQTPFGLLVDGWLTNVGRRDLVLMSSDLVAMTPVEDFIIWPRPDVKQRLMADTFSRASGQFHGFSASLPGCREGNRAIYILERLPYGSQVVGPIPYRPIADRDQALRLACNRLMGMPEADANAALAFLGPLLATPQMSVKADVNQFGPDGPGPRLSIIVPVSGSDIFLRSLIAQQRRLKLDVEWILCAEAGVGSRSVLRLLSAHQGQLQQPVVLVEADTDATVSMLMNAGARLARARSLLFLDETAWIERPRTINKALKDLESGLCEAVSLLTLLDDRGVDHAGFMLRPDPHYRNLMSLEPIGRGLPLPRALRRGHSLHIPDAVSAAGLCISSDAFEQTGGFDERISSADMAGADLTIRLRHMGGRISLSADEAFVRGFDGRAHDPGQDAVTAAFELLDRFRLARSVNAVRAAVSLTPNLTDGHSA